MTKERGSTPEALERRPDGAGAEDRAIHLKHVLRAVREVNRLIVSEEDPLRLIERACVTLTETMGYLNAWIVLLDDDGRTVTSAAAAGFDGGFAVLEGRLRTGGYPDCMKQGLAGDAIIVVADPQKDCPDCPLSREYGGRAGLSRRLQYGGRTYGVLSVSVPAGFAGEEEEHALFDEMACDLAFALHKIEAARDLRESRAMLAKAERFGRFGSWEWDTDRDRVRWSEGLFRVFRMDPACGTPSIQDYTDLFFPEDRQRAREVIECCLADGTPYELELRVRRADGEVRHCVVRGQAETDAEGRIRRLGGSLQDITERKRAEEFIDGRERYLSAILQTTADGFFVLDRRGRVIDVNDAYCAMSGYEREELIGMGIRDLDVYESPAETAARIERIMAHGSETFEARHGRKDGSVWPVEVSATWVDEDGGRFVCFGRDLTERKEREDRITLLGRMLDEAPAAITIHDADGRFLFANRQTVRLHGYRDEAEFLSVNLSDLDAPESEALQAERFRRVAEEGEARFEVAHHRKDGSTFPLEVLTKSIEWDGRPAILSIATDITERKRAEESIRGRERYLSAILQTAADGFFVLDRRGRVIDVNDAYCSMSGYAREELIGMGVGDLDATETPEATANHVERIRTNGSEIFETRHRRRDGTVWPVEVSAAWLEEDGGRFVNFGRDLTERKEREDRIALLGRMLDEAPAAITIHDADGRFLFANRQTVRLHGYRDEAEFLPVNLSDLDAPESEALQAERFRRVAEEGEARFEVTHHRKDGSTFPLEVLTKSIELDGRPAILSIATDITERKRAENDLRRTTELLDSVRRAQAMYIAQGDTQPVFHALLETLITMTGSEFGFLDEVHRDTGGLYYKLNLAISNISWDAGSKALYKRLRSCNFEFRNLKNLAGLPALMEKPVIANDAPRDPRSGGLPPGHPPVRSFMGLPIWSAGEVVGVVGVANRPGGYDEEMARFLEPYLTACAGIIEGVRLRARERDAVLALHESEEKYRLLVDTANEGVWSMDEDDVTTYVNQAMARMLGYTTSDMLGKKMEEFIFPEDVPFHEERVRRRHAGEDESYEQRFRRRDGLSLWATVSAKALKDDDGRFAGSFALYTDITERKRAEQAIRESEERFSSAFRYAPIGMALVSPEGKWFKVNRAACDFLGYSEDELLTRTFQDVTHPEDLAPSVACMKQILAGTIRTDQMERRYIHKQGHTIRALQSVSLVRDAEGAPSYFISQIVDITERKRAEESLRLHSLTLNQIEDKVTVTDLNGFITYVNESACRMIGKPREELIGQHVSIYGEYPAEGKTPEQIIRRTLQDGSWRGEVTYSGKRGLRPILDCRTHVVKDDTGRPIALCAICTDMTVRKRAENALRESEERFRALVDAAPMSIVLLRKGKYVFGNPQSARLLGLASPEELVGVDALQTIAPEFHDIVRERMRRIAQGGSNPPMELRIVRPNGDSVWSISASVSVQMDGEPTAIIVGQDISEWKRAEEELRKRENLLQRIFEILPVGLWFVEKDGTILRGNPMGVKIWGAEPHVSISEYGIFKAWRLPSRELIEPDDWALAKTIRDGVTISDELLEIEDVDGRRKTILNSTAPVLDDRGNVQGAIVVNLDITERKNLEDQLLQAQKMESVGRLAGGVAHDFNNMLSVILGYTELAMDKIAPSDALYRDLQEILNAARRSADITRQLLAFARKQTIAPRVLDLNDTVEGMLKMLRRLIGEDIDLVWRPAKGLWPVMMDPSQLDQILANLCVNARDAITGVGKLVIETGRVTLDEADCAKNPGFVPGEYVLLAVSDNGCGMDQETLEHLFEPFFTTKGVGKGTGLGLATVYGIVKQNNGFIYVDSKRDGGTTFKIYLPRRAGDAGHARTESAERIPAARGEVVLIVEDDVAMLRLTRAMIEKLGYTVLGASTHIEAMELARAHVGRIDLLVTDVIMPEINGLDLANQLRVFYPEIKTLFMSGYTANVIAHQGVLADGVQFIQKPFSIEDIAQKLRRVLGGGV